MASQAHAPVKDQPHPFQTPLSIQIVVPNADAGVDGAVLDPATDKNCALCNLPLGDQIHVAGQALADGDSARWGL
jgi:hypothetical protein